MMRKHFSHFHKHKDSPGHHVITVYTKMTLKPCFRGVIFHRHGHRAPAKALNGNDVDVWKPLIVSRNTLDSLAARFPIISHSNNGKEKDLLTQPFGCLTNKGLSHLVEKGRALGRKFPFLKNLPPDCYRVFATNYQRTQLSVCGLLSGLMKEPSLSKRVEINVRPIASCSMSFYDGQTEKATSLIKSTQATKKFSDLEDSEAVIRVKKALSEKWPRLLLKSPDLRSFDWPAAFDHFACRKAHKLPVWLGDTGESEGEAYDMLGKFVSDHMASRFWLYYQDAEHLRSVAKPLLIDLYQSLSTSTSNEATDITGGSTILSNSPSFSPPPSLLTIFSGHDVTILSLLTALGSDLISKDSPTGFWPEYGDVLFFQLQADQQTVQAFMNNIPLNLFGTKASSFKLSQLQELIQKL